MYKNTDYNPNPNPAPVRKHDFGRISKVDEVCMGGCNLKTEIDEDVWFDCVSRAEEVCVEG